jgi:hypothetical protein
MHRGMSTTKSHTRGLFLSLLESFAGSLQSFDLEASLLDADFCFDGTTVPDMFAVSDPFGDDGTILSPHSYFFRNICQGVTHSTPLRRPKTVYRVRCCLRGAVGSLFSCGRMLNIAENGSAATPAA